MYTEIATENTIRSADAVEDSADKPTAGSVTYRVTEEK